MSEPEATSIDGFDFHGQWKAFHVPLPITIGRDADLVYRAMSQDPFAFGTGKTPEAAVAALRVHLGKQYDVARWAAEMVD